MIRKSAIVSISKTRLSIIEKKILKSTNRGVLFYLAEILKAAIN